MPGDVRMDAESGRRHRRPGHVLLVRDGLVHQIAREETDDKYGRTSCSVTFTTDAVHERYVDHVVGGRDTNEPLTCMQCAS